jgi:hypothetical protein
MLKEMAKEKEEISFRDVTSWKEKPANTKTSINAFAKF